MLLSLSLFFPVCFQSTGHISEGICFTFVIGWKCSLLHMLAGIYASLKFRRLISASGAGPSIFKAWKQ